MAFKLVNDVVVQIWLSKLFPRVPILHCKVFYIHSIAIQMRAYMLITHIRSTLRVEYFEV